MAKAKANDELVFLPLGGSNEIGMNFNLYGFGPPDARKWIVVDVGVTFGDATTPGVEVIMPDPSFIEERADDILGIVLTHAHEDHIGAMGYLWRRLQAPIYATPFTAFLLREKLRERGVLAETDITEVPLGGKIDLGPFQLELITLTHSIPEPNGLAIRTPLGTILHTGDWKIDADPLLGGVTDIAAIRRLGDEGVLAMVCDSTNVFVDGSAGSEAEVRVTLTKLIASLKGKIAAACFASNVARMDTIIRAAQANDRRVCLVGRSMHRMAAAARHVGLFQGVHDFVSEDESGYFPPENILYLCTGSQGEPRAALARIADDSHSLGLSEGDVVLFSSRQIPGNELAIGRIQNQLAERGIEMVTDRQSDIHVSGHPGRPELEALYGWIRPDILVPVHGEMRHMQEQARLGRSRGIPHAVVQQNGDIVRLAPGEPGKLAHVTAGRLVLDGDIIVPADGEAIVTRRRIARDGILFVALDAEHRAQIHGFGLPLDEDYGEFIAEAERDVTEALGRLKGPKARDREAIVEAARIAARRAAQRWSGKKPQTKVILLEDRTA